MRTWFLKKFVKISLIGVYLVCFGVISNGFSEKIKAIEILGNKTIATKKILAVIKVKKGDEFIQENLNKDIRNIYDLGLFDEVVLDVQPIEEGEVKIVFKVLEKMLIKRIDFKGNKKFSINKLKGEISLKEKEAFDKKKMADDIEKISSTYKDKGYADAKIEAFTTAQEEDGLVVVTFFITEGNRITIKEINFAGINGFPVKKIQKRMKTKIKKTYKEDVFKNDLEIIKLFYKQNGYMKVEISEPEITYNEQRTEMYIKISVQEGYLFKLGEIDFTGNTIFEKKILKDSFMIKEGEIFNEDKYNRSMMNIRNLYAEKGYIRAEIDPIQEFDEENGIVKINFELTERGRVYIDRIYIEGNIITKEYVVRRELLVKEGDPFNVGKIQRSQEKIYNLGFFEDVKVDVEQTDLIDKADLVFSVAEQKTGLASIGAGYSSEDGVLGTMQVSQTNLFGRGQRINLLWEFGEKKQNYEIGFAEPWLFGTHTSFGMDVFDTVRIKDYVYHENDIERTDRYKEGRKGGNMRMGRRLTDIYSVSLSYAYEEVKIFDADSDYMKTQEGMDVTSSLTSYFTRDSRDNIFDASRGSKNSLSAEVAGGVLGGNNDFTKSVVSTSWFVPTFWNFVLVFHGEAGIVKEFGRSKQVPIYERFYVGGAESVRGYDYRGQIGPSEGGNLMSFFNVEYKFPIVMEKGRTILQGAIFADVGGSWAEIDEVNFNIGKKNNWMKSGAGIGIRFKTPVFPIRLDWGYGLNHKETVAKSNRHQWYFTIGQVF